MDWKEHPASPLPLLPVPTGDVVLATWGQFASAGGQVAAVSGGRQMDLDGRKLLAVLFLLLYT
jgi:hypothetical protein